MSWLPVFFKPRAIHLVVFGAGARAERKLRFLERFDCSVDRFALESSDTNSAISVVSSIEAIDLRVYSLSTLFIAACEDDRHNDAFAQHVRAAGFQVHVSESLAQSDFLLPALIDRDPVMVAVSSAGQHPTLTRLVRSRIETALPARLGALANIAVSYRDKVRQAFSSINARRRFWERHLEGRVADLVYSGHDDEARAALDSALEQSKASNITAEGEVYLVGAGPGDPDLLSFKALRLMRQADVVLFDRLVSQDILNLVRQDADLIDVGKRRAEHTMPQDGINQLLADLAKQGKRVLRLKGGDPFIFGRGGEEIETLAEQGVSFQVVPGITAAAGCASYSGIPLTHRDYAQSVRFVTGHLKNHSSDLAWGDLVGAHQTLVFYMGLVALPEIATQLIAHGKSAGTPVAVISKGTLPDQAVVISDLENISEAVRTAKIKAPTIIIVGDVVKLREKLSWSSS